MKISSAGIYFDRLERADTEHLLIMHRLKPEVLFLFQWLHLPRS